MIPEKKKKSSKKCVLYPVSVLFACMAIAVIVPMLWDAVNAAAFGRLMGRMAVPAFFVALVVGLISDRKHSKKTAQDLG
jgi:Na+/glutamate symporter